MVENDRVMSKTQTPVDETTLAKVKARYRSLKRAGASTENAMLCALDEEGQGYGIESISAKYADTEVFYANTGETYARTILCFHNWKTKRARFILGNWGDLVESGRYA